MAEKTREDVFERIAQILFSLMWLGTGSRKTGQPDQAHVNAKDHCTALLQNQNLSPESEVFSAESSTRLTPG
jgi:hypothetical protein